MELGVKLRGKLKATILSKQRIIQTKEQRTEKNKEPKRINKYQCFKQKQFETIRVHI